MRLRPLAVFLFFFGSALGAEAQSTTLAYKFKKGDRNDYEFIQDVKMTQTINGQVNATEMKQTFQMVLIVDEVLANGSARIVNKFDHVKLEMTAPAPIGNVVFDSNDENPGGDNPAAPILGKLIKMLARVQFSAGVSSRGESSDAKIPKEFLEEIKNLPGAGQFGDMFSEQGLKNLTAQSGVILPKEAQTKGASWPHKIDVKMPFGTMITKFKYVYEGNVSTRDRLEKITFVPEASVELNPDSPIGMTIDSQKGEGTVLFDNSVGRVHQTDLTQTIDMTVAAQNLVVSQRIEQKISLRLKMK